MGTTPRISNNRQPNMYWGHQWWIATVFLPSTQHLLGHQWGLSMVIIPSTQHLLGTPMGVSHGHYTVYPTFIGDINGGFPMIIIVTEWTFYFHLIVLRVVCLTKLSHFHKSCTSATHFPTTQFIILNVQCCDSTAQLTISTP